MPLPVHLLREALFSLLWSWCPGVTPGCEPLSAPPGPHTACTHLPC
jgi:hypothetical protein